MSNDTLPPASYARRRLIGQLRRSEVPEPTAVAAVLEGCTEANPCRSAACPVCGEAFQEAAVSLIENMIRGPARAIRSRMTAVTIVPSTGCVDPGELSVELCRRVAAEVPAALRTARVGPSITGLEVSFNEDLTGKVEPHCCVHTHSIVLDWLSEGQVASLRAEFPASHCAKRPVYIEPLDQNSQGRRYPFKHERVRRETYLHPGNEDRKPYRDTRKRDLRPWQAVRLAIVEHQLGFKGRLLTHGINEKAVRQHLRGLGWARDGP